MLENIARFDVGPGWAAFGDRELYLRFATILIAATVSSALLAYHPVYRRRAISLADIDLRKTLIIYGIVGALIAVICTVSPSMAFVIFGIGGLMRFRTDVGASKDTGHTIMATLIGLCWGLGLELVAVLATLFFWALIFALERSPPAELTVGGVSLLDMGRAADAYRAAIARAGGRVLGHAKDFKRTQMSFVYRLPVSSSEEDLAREVAAIPDGLRGTPDWRGQ
jgi:hypothetical protein